MRQGFGVRGSGSRLGLKVASALLSVTLAFVGALAVAGAPAASASTGTFSVEPVVGVRTGGPDACGIGAVAGTNCAVTIVLDGSGLPVADPSTVGIQEYGNSTLVSVVDNDDGGSGWQAGHDTDTFTTCKVLIGESTSSVLILAVGDLGPTCPGYSIEPGDSVRVTLYTDGTGGTVFDSETVTASAAPTDPATEPSVGDVNPPTGPQGGGTDAAPGSGAVTVTTSNAGAPEAVWFSNPSGLTGATGVATNNFTPVDATHVSVVPPASGAQANEGVSVLVADQASGTSPEACAVLLPGGCPDEYMYMSEHADTFGPSAPFNLNWSDTLAQTSAAGSSACGTGGTSGVSAGLSIGGSVTGGGLGLAASYGVSESELGVPETIVGSATLTVVTPIVITVSLSGTLAACEQIPIPDLAIPNVAGFYFVVGGSISGSATLTITINQGTYTLGGGFIPGSNADDTRGASVVSNCVDSNGNPTTDCVTTAISASLTGTLTVSPLWLQVGPSFANVGAGLTAGAIGTITYPPLSVDGDICVAGNWVAQVNVGPLSGSTGGNWLGPFNIVGDGSICPFGSTVGSGSSAPGAPVDATASAGDGQATVNWSPPASDGGSAVTGYNVYEGTSPGGESTTPVNASPLAADATSLPVTGLTDGTTYYFTVTAINSVAEGTTSNEASATPSAGTTVPGAPIGLSASGGNAQVALNWSPPTFNGGSAITGYNVYKGTTAGGESATPVNASPLAASASSYTATGLTNGTNYFFTVKAINAVGTGAVSNEASATPTAAATLPSAPIGLTASPGNGQASLNWSAPASNGGSALTGYNVYEGTATGGESATPMNASPLPATATSYSATGLTNGTKYFFTVKALNGVGTGAASNEASATPSAATTVPGAPTSLTAAPGKTQASLYWSPPASNGGSIITGYNIYEGTTAGGESATPVNASPVGGSSTSYLVTGLTNGTKYYFTVKAINAVGTGAASNEASATPTAAKTVPTAPVNLTAGAGNARATLTWSPPLSNGGSAITGYNVYKGTASGGESATPLNPSPLPASALTYVATGLRNGTRYYFKVKAINAQGAGALSNQASATPAAPTSVPSSPRTLKAVATKGKVSLTWAAPASNGGTVITGFSVFQGTTVGGESIVPVNRFPLGNNATQSVIVGLTNGTTYYFTVRAINADGIGAASNEVAATPGTVPGALVLSTAVAGNASAALTWAAPTSTGGSPITGYNVYKATVSGGQTSTPVNASPLAATARAYTATGLTNGTRYYFKVRAINAVGIGTNSNQLSAIPLTVPGAPTALKGVAGKAKVTLTWVAPTATGGSRITGYNVYEGTVSGGESATPVNATPIGAAAKGYTATGLTNGTKYYFTIRAINVAGTGPASNQATATPGPA